MENQFTEFSKITTNIPVTKKHVNIRAWRGCGGESVALRLRGLLPVGVVLGAVLGGSALKS